MRQVIIAALLLAALSGTAVAGAFEEAVLAHERRDYAAAMKWYTLAAEEGNTYAQYNVGFMYANGQGVPQDYAEAMWWYRWAACTPTCERGHTGAQHALGVMYDFGQGVPQDYAKALKWYRTAAERGLMESLLNLAFMYANGQGVEKDYVQAYMFFNLVLSQGVKGMGVRRSRNAIAKDMTPAQIEEAAKLALEWRPK